MWRLLVRSRLRAVPSVGMALVLLLAAGAAAYGRSRTGAGYDLSGLGAVTAPGLFVAFALTVGTSELEEIEAVARPRPQLLTLATIVLVVLGGGAVLAAVTPADPGADYGRVELVRNILLYLGIGLVPGALGRWRASPYVTGAVAVVVTGLFGITRTDSILLWLAQPARSPAEIGAAAALPAAAALGILGRSRR